jgi:hypothetical protein
MSEEASSDEIIAEIENVCLERMSREELFYDLLKQIGKHAEEVAMLKKEEDRPGHLQEEIVDIMLLTKGLFYLEGINDAQVIKGAKYTLNMVREAKENG